MPVTQQERTTPIAKTATASLADLPDGVAAHANAAAVALTQAPRHVAIIMDGNGRWAAARGQPRIVGHREGARAVRRTVEAAIEADVRWLTLYAFSSENWRRPAGEVLDLTGCCAIICVMRSPNCTPTASACGLIGDRARFSADIRADMDAAERRTADNTRLELTIALSYGAREEIVSAVRQAMCAARDGTLNPADINEAAFGQLLYTADTPAPT